MSNTARMWQVLRVLEYVRDHHPDQFDWGEWLWPPEQPVNQPPLCGTKACILGWCALNPAFNAQGLEFHPFYNNVLGKTRYVIRYGHYWTSTAGSSFLELENSEPQELFYGEGDIYDAIRLVEGMLEGKPKPTHYVHKNSGNALFVKEAEFFKSQGGLTEEWGQHWQPVIATSIGAARRQAAVMFNVPLSSIHAGEE